MTSGNKFNRIQKIIPHGHKIDTYYDSAVFSQILPDDYLTRSRKITNSLKRIDLRALDLVDIVLTKVGRLSKHDVDDIKSCIRNCNLTRDEIISRGTLVAAAHVDSEHIYRNKLDAAIKEFFT